MFLSIESRFLFKDERVIAFNRAKGSWLKFSKECYLILKDSISKGLSREQLIHKLENNEDKEYFEKLLSLLYQIEILTDTEGLFHQTKRSINDVSISLTRKCNLSCAHCIVDAQSAFHKDKYDTSNMKKIIDKVKAINPKNITLTGGEPMMRKDFFEILNYTALDFEGNISLMTNGTLINQNNIKEISKNVNNINISIDGVDEESCAIVRGKGVFEKVIKSIHMLKNHGVEKISLSMVLTRNNGNLITEFLELNEVLGTKPMMRSLMIEGRAIENEQVLKEKQIIKEETPQKKEHKRTDIKGCSCSAGIDELTIEYDGEIYPCNLFVDKEFSLGNIDDVENINSILDTEKDKGCAHSCLQAYEPDHHTLCKNCEVNLFCWSCLHDLYRLEKDKESFMNRCSYMKSTLNELIWEQ